MNKPILSALIGSLLLCACASSDVNYERYNLTMDVGPGVYQSPVLDNISVQSNLVVDSGGVLMQLTDVSLVESPNYRYATGLAGQLKLILASLVLEHQLNKNYSYNLSVTKFWGNTQGEAVCAISLAVENKGKRVHEYAGEKIADLENDGFTELVVKLKQSYEELIEEALSSL